MNTVDYKKMNQKIEAIKMKLFEAMEMLEEFEAEYFPEQWREIKNYPNYEVSNLGRVRIIKTGKIKKQFLDKKGYYNINLYKKNKRQKFSVHRLVGLTFILNPENKKCIDHKDTDRTNNNVKNLRWVTHSENGYNQQLSSNNTSGIKGVSYDKSRKKWRAQIKINGKKIHLGYFKSLEEAKHARQTKAKQIFGEFLNECEIN